MHPVGCLCRDCAFRPGEYQRARDAQYTKVLHDAINRPAHYTRGGIEVCDAIEAWGLGYHLGNVVKYVARAGHKDPAKELEDLKKARWYLDRAIARKEASK